MFADKNPCWSIWTEYREWQEFASFMRQAPDVLLQDSSGTKSYHTRELTIYDTHLVDRQVLKHVIYLPHLATRIGEAVDERLRELTARRGSRKQVLPRVTDDKKFPTKLNRELGKQIIADKVRYKRGVVNQYMNATGYPCGIVASTMMLHPHSKLWQSFLTCTTDPAGDEDEGERATADLYLKISDKFRSNDKQMRADLRSSEKRMLDWEGVRYYFPHLMAFEVKSLLAGNGKVMKEIQRMGERGSNVLFPWKSCENRTCKKHEFSTGRLGRDVLSPGSGLLSESSPNVHQSPWFLPTSMGSPMPVLNLSEDEQTDDDSQTSDDETNDADPDFIHRIELGRPGTVMDPDPPGTMDDHTESAEHIIQQVWAKAVHIDATFVAIVAGNYEILGVRHRGTQTLYITQVIHVGVVAGLPNNRLHTGMYISILKDALERVQLIKANYKDNNGLPTLPKGFKDFIPPTVAYEPGTFDPIENNQGGEGSGSNSSSTATTPKARTKELPPLVSISAGNAENVLVEGEESGLRTPRVGHRELPQQELRSESEDLRAATSRELSQRSYRSVSSSSTPSSRLPSGSPIASPWRASFSGVPASIPNSESAFAALSQTHTGLSQLSEPSATSNSRATFYTPERTPLPHLYRQPLPPSESTPSRPHKISKHTDGDFVGDVYSKRRK